MQSDEEARVFEERRHLSKGKTTEIIMRGGRAESELRFALALGLVEAMHAGNLWGPRQKEFLVARGCLQATFC